MGQENPSEGRWAPDSVQAIRTAMRGWERCGLGDREGQLGWGETAHVTA